MRVPRLISGVRVIGRRLGLRVLLGTSTWRRYWWSEVLIPLQSTRALAERRRFCLLAGNGISTRCGYVSSAALIRIGRTKRVGRFCMTRAKTVTSTRRGCCWTTARRSIGPRRTDWTPLYHRLQNGHVDVARLLLDKGAEVDPANKDGATPLSIACEKGHVDAARLLLLEKGAGRPARRRCTSPRTATSTWCGCCWTTARRSIGRTKNGGRRCWIACKKGHVDAAPLLLEKGAEVDQAQNDGRDAAVRRLPEERPRQRGAAVAG